MVHELNTGIVPPARLTLELPVAAVSVPPQVLVLPEPETVRPLGRVSANDVILAAVAFWLINVMVAVESPSTEMLIGENDLVNEGETIPATTVRVALAGVVLLPLLVCNDPARSVLV